jgi:putative spermidine/putrescine transport system substrate-binding protein
MKDRILATAAVLFMAGATAQAQERTLTISVYAFAQDAYAKIVYQPFEKECGCNLVVETGNRRSSPTNRFFEGGGLASRSLDSSA